MIKKIIAAIVFLLLITLVFAQGEPAAEISSDLLRGIKETIKNIFENIELETLKARVSTVAETGSYNPEGILRETRAEAQLAKQLLERIKRLQGITAAQPPTPSVSEFDEIKRILNELK